MNLAQWLYASALAQPNAPALFLGTKLQANYRAFANQACQLGHWLRQNHNIQHGDRVAIYAPNCIEYLPALYGCWWIGAVTVPINPMLHPRVAAWIANNPEASLIFTETGAEFTPIQLPASYQDINTHEAVATPAITDAPPTPPRL